MRIVQPPNKLKQRKKREVEGETLATMVKQMQSNMKKKKPNRRLTFEGIWFAEKAFAPAKSAAATKSCVFTILSKVNVLK